MKKLIYIMALLLVFTSIMFVPTYAEVDPLKDFDITWLDEKYNRVEPFIEGTAIAYTSYKENGDALPTFDERVFIDKRGIKVADVKDTDGSYTSITSSSTVEPWNSSYNDDLLGVIPYPMSPWSYNSKCPEKEEYFTFCGGYEIHYIGGIGEFMNSLGKTIVEADVVNYFVTYDDLILLQIADENKDTPDMYSPYTCYNTNGDVVITGIDPDVRTGAMGLDDRYLPFAERPSVWKQLDNGKYEPYDYSDYIDSKDAVYKLILPFNEGLTSLQNEDNGKYGILDRNANVVVPYVLDEPAFFNQGLAVIKYNGRYGIMKDPRKAEEVAGINSFIMAEELFDLGLFQGVSKDEFLPELNEAVTSYEAITLIGRALEWDVDKNATSSFTDVPSWAVPYTEYARDKGITSGVSSKDFGKLVNGRRIITWFLAAMGEDKEDVWRDTYTYSMKYNMPITVSNVRNDVVHIIYQGIQFPVVGEDTPLIDKIRENNKPKQ